MSDELPDLDDEDQKKSGKPRLTPPAGGFVSIPENHAEFAPLKKKDFASQVLYHDYQINLLQEKIARHEKAKATLTEFGENPSAVKAAKKTAKLIEKLRKIREESDPADFKAALGPELANLKELFNL